ncbi:hypothetical protein C2845_PM11G02930 [Panicum miliaceum]|uniref:Uncharacterized protein n=1 Tax=Panicum miliaceum TaxID=4540 RepID=A0A3L6RN24_PANMI|nr:hypothetical protein C2845_PM11G02930 [Panicum miliaceum]
MRLTQPITLDGTRINRSQQDSTIEGTPSLRGESPRSTRDTTKPLYIARWPRI